MHVLTYGTSIALYIGMKTKTHNIKGLNMKFETLKQAVKHFTDNGIDHDKGIEYVLAFQDAIGQRSIQDTLDSFQDMDQNERGNFLWVSCHCLDKDMFLEILKKSVCQAVINEEVTYLDNMYIDRLAELKIREKAMTELEKQNAVNIEKIKLLEMEMNGLKGSRNSLMEKADSFDIIKRLLIA
jgi:hypothetical protein